MLSTPADAMLSSTLFADFTREVAARIIQHYWREHINRCLTAQDHSGANATPQQGREHLTEHEADSNHDEAPGHHANQEESLADAMRRYRKEEGIKPAATRNSTQQVTSSGVQLEHGHGLVARRTTASAARVSCHADASVDQAQGSMSRLDKLKKRQGKQRRLEQPMAQHAKLTLQTGAETLPEAPQQDRSAALAGCRPAADSAQQAQQAYCSKAQESSCAAESAKSDHLTDSSRGLEQESSDSALLQMLNPRRIVHNIAPPVEPSRVSTDGIPLQQQQQQQWQQEPNGRMTMHDDLVPQPGCDENVSPNLSPNKLHAKRCRNQNEHAKASAAATAELVHQETNPPFCKMESEHAGDKAADDGTASHAMHSSSQRQKSDRVSSNKLADIFAFLDVVEAQAEAEAANVVQSHAAHRSSLYDQASVYHPSSSLHHAPSTDDGHQLQHHPVLPHLEQKVNRPRDSSMSQRRRVPAHEAACSSSATMHGGSQATGPDQEHNSSVTSSKKHTKGACGQAASNAACTAETGSTGQYIAPVCALITLNCWWCCTRAQL